MKSNRHKSFLLPAIILAFGIVLIQSCTKTPTPAFSFQPLVNPEAGDTIFFTNASLNATIYDWNFGDGNNSSVMDPMHIYDASGSYDVSLTASNPKKSENVTETIVINDPTILSVQTLEDDEQTPVANVEVWVYDSEEHFTNNYFEPQFAAYTDENGLASFYNLEAQVYIVDVYLETDSGSWSGYYPNIDALTLNEENAWGLIMDFKATGATKGLENKRSNRTQGLETRSFKK